MHGEYDLVARPADVGRTGGFGGKAYNSDPAAALQKAGASLLGEAPAEVNQRDLCTDS